ncbi:MAG: YopX family protein [Acinetobacter junii]
MIKYRQFINNRFHYWGYIDNVFIGPITNNEPNPINSQFTGLLDINGVEIYEGDLITADCYPFYSDGELNYIAEVQYIDDPDYLGWYYDLHVVSDRVRGSACGSGLPDLTGMKLTVIGNIYQNSELVE